MKTILVLTDFSKNAACAAEAGLMLSAKLHTDILLFNTYIDYATMPSYAGGVWIVDEFSDRKKHSKLGLGMLMEGMELLSDKLGPDDRRPAIHCQADDCDLGLDVADIIQQNDIELVVMGASSCAAPDDFAAGADTDAVINNVTRPVLIIPAPTNLNQVRKVMFATDYSKIDIKAIHYLAKLGKLFSYQLEIIHITGPGKGTSKSANELAFHEQIAKLDYQGLTYREAGGKDIINSLNSLITETGAHLLAMSHRQYPFFIRIFKHSIAKKALSRLKVPLLIFPSNMK